ncbi:MAG: ABC transporter substrate-binding protein [Anaerolineae bacterium]|nr:ABC transporter substrate-binding protein [Anaerolineae bacterium]
MRSHMRVLIVFVAVLMLLPACTGGQAASTQVNDEPSEMVPATGEAAPETAEPAPETAEPIPGTAEPTPSLAETMPVRLLLTYIPNVQFAPFYVGIEKEFFAGYGLYVNIEHKGESDVVKLVGTGEADFGIVSGEQVLLARAQDIPVVYTFAWYQKFPVAVASKKELGIASPADLAGRSIGTPAKEGASYIGLEALLASAGLTDADINLQTTGYTQVETLMTDRVEAVVVYIANEPIQLEAQGVEVNVLNVSDYAKLVSNGLITSQRAIDGNPGLIYNMAAALAQSIQYTIDHPDEAFEISKKYVEGLDDPAVEAAQKQVLARSIELWKADRIGLNDPAAWQAMQTVLIGSGLLNSEQDLQKAYTDQFLP